MRSAGGRGASSGSDFASGLAALAAAALASFASIERGAIFPPAGGWAGGGGAAPPPPPPARRAARPCPCRFCARLLVPGLLLVGVSESHKAPDRSSGCRDCEQRAHH